MACGLAALGIGPGDEVIVPAYTWIASAAAVLMVGAVPVIAEVDDALTLDPEDTESRITSRTAALLPVHMRGAPCNMDALVNLASQRGLHVLEDAAQACGASYHGKRLGTIGDVGAFSLQFNKILTSGEGGLVTTDDRDRYERALLFHDVAAIMRDDLDVGDNFVGITCRMSELQGAVALAQLGKLEQILSDMRANFAFIRDRVSGSPPKKVSSGDGSGTGRVTLASLLLPTCLMPSKQEGLSKRSRPRASPLKCFSTRAGSTSILPTIGGHLVLVADGRR